MLPSPFEMLTSSIPYRVLSVTSQKYRSFLSKCCSTFSKPIFEDAVEAIKDIPSNSTILSGGFGFCGYPEQLLMGLSKTDINGLTVVSSNGDNEAVGLAILLNNNQIVRMVTSHIDENSDFESKYLNGELEVEFNPRGTLVERLRAGAAGIPAFYTRTGYQTPVHKGQCPVRHDRQGNPVEFTKPKETRVFDGIEYIMEEAIVGDYGLVHAWKADKFGNLLFRKTARNFNVPMAKAAKFTIAEVEELVPTDSLDPDHIHVPGVFVNRILISAEPTERIQRRINPPMKTTNQTDPKNASRMRIVRRAACEIQDGMYVNLSTGLPSMLPDVLPPDRVVHVLSENGVLGVGPYPLETEVDADLINGGMEPITVQAGASYFSSDESFVMVRGGHIDMNFLDAFQVSAHGDLANWMIPDKTIKGMGSAMDFASAPNTRIVVMMEHTSVDGKPRILPECTMPLTGVRCVDLIITDLAVFTVDPVEGLTLTELAESVSLDRVNQATGVPFSVLKSLTPMLQI